MTTSDQVALLALVISLVSFWLSYRAHKDAQRISAAEKRTEAHAVLMRVLLEARDLRDCVQVAVDNDTVEPQFRERLAAKNDRLRSFVVSWLAGTVLWVQSVVPLGAAFGAGLASGPSSSVASHFFISFWVYSIFLLAALEASVFYPRVPEMQEPTGRSRRFGFLLLVSGVLVQLVAAFKDLYA